MPRFYQENPSLESYWRSVILFGQNSATYKFALAKSLLDLADAQTTAIKLEDLAVPFSKHIAEHLKSAPRQGTSRSSRYLTACQQYNAGAMHREDLIRTTVAVGFNNVLDAFHIVNQAPIPVRFFVDERRAGTRIVVTDELLKLKESLQFQNLPFETEARWKLVEAAWRLDISQQLLEIQHDAADSSLFAQAAAGRRISVTSARDALNGYQKGKCFYCFADVSVKPAAPNLADVDHFFSRALMLVPSIRNLDQIWNLVLACYECNRGHDGKFARLPRRTYLDRLHKRNSFLIDSHHPLSETLMQQTGLTEDKRRQFLNALYNTALDLLNRNIVWTPPYEHEPTF